MLSAQESFPLRTELQCREVGERRWEAPAAPECKEDAVISATDFSAMCVQVLPPPEQFLVAGATPLYVVRGVAGSARRGCAR